MASFELIHPMIRAVIPASIPKFTMTDAVREAARTFCTDTALAQEQHTITTEVGVKSYSLVIPDESISNVVVLSAEVDEKPYTDRYFCPNTETILFEPVPRDIEDIVLTIAVKPSLSANDLGYSIIEEYAEVLRDGALSVLYSQAGSEWFEPNAANLYKARFESSINDIIVRRSDGFTSGHETATGGFW